ncbi:MAG: efflux RND transporter periplasmic adaptor subunit [Xanthomonadaceae bacterium]|nr:efflux RND transporter periplasmic adaptor subunit [Xanthomonadaceae bacterium]
MPIKLPHIRPRYWLAGIAVVALAALAYYLVLANRDNAPAYTTATLDYGDITQTVSANGTLNPVTVVQVGSQVSGTVQKLFVDFNSRVRQGEVLAELDPTLFKAQVAQDTANLHGAEATLALDRLNEQRARQLHATHYVSQADLDQAVASVRTARAQVEAATAQLQRDRTSLAYTVIRSPVDGVVINRAIDVGQTVAASFQTPTLFSIGQNLRNMQIDVTVDEADVGQIKPGQTVNFSVDAFPDRRFIGKVVQVRLNATVQQNVVTYDVVVGVDNPEGKLLPGMTAYANIVVLTRRHVLLAPNAALRVRIAGQQMPGTASGSVLYVLADGKLRGVPVKTGASDGQHTEITSGAVKAGEQVVTGFAAVTARRRNPFQMF